MTCTILQGMHQSHSGAFETIGGFMATDHAMSGRCAATAIAILIFPHL